MRSLRVFVNKLDKQECDEDPWVLKYANIAALKGEKLDIIMEFLRKAVPRGSGWMMSDLPNLRNGFKLNPGSFVFFDQCLVDAHSKAKSKMMSCSDTTLNTITITPLRNDDGKPRLDNIPAIKEYASWSKNIPNEDDASMKKEHEVYFKICKDCGCKQSMFMAHTYLYGLLPEGNYWKEEVNKPEILVKTIIELDKTGLFGVRVFDALAKVNSTYWEKDAYWNEDLITFALNGVSREFIYRI